MQKKQTEQMNKKKCYHYAFINNDFLFIFKDRIESFYKDCELIKEDYRGKEYYRYPKTSKRISAKSLNKKSSECNILL